jgi:cation:H+ antiporter
MSSALLFVAGLAALLVGAELLVRGGTGIALRLGIRPIVVGLTVVSIGTSMPELAIGIDAARTGSPELAAGNIVGTNLINLLLILGLSAVIVPIMFERRTLRFDLPSMAVASLLLYVLARDGDLDRWDGVLLCVGAVAYTGEYSGRAERSPTSTRHRRWCIRNWAGRVVGYPRPWLGSWPASS